MKVLIIEDEKPAVSKLMRLLNQLDTDIEVIDTLPSVEGALNWLQHNPEPELIFLDVQLEDGTCFDIFESKKITAPVIFTTAYDQYALKAFKLNSIDYLLKPIDRNELKKAVEKFKTLHLQTNGFQHLETVLHQLPIKRKERFLIKIGDHYKSILTSNIDCFFINERCTFIHTENGRTYGIDYSLEKVEELVDPNQFFRVNRNYIVNFTSITDIISYSSSRLKVKIKGLDDTESILVSRERVGDFKRWMDR